MQVFAKRFWGFDPKRWPIVAFSLEANRDALIKASRPGDRVAFIGTQKEPTASEERGNILGLAEIGRIPLDSIAVIDPQHIRPFDRLPNGSFRWPKALPILRAWKCRYPRPVTTVLRQQLTYEATVRAVILDETDRNAVLGLELDEIAVPDLPILNDHRALNTALLGNGPTRGIPPSSWSGTVTHNAGQEARTYALRFGMRNVWKIGYAIDVNARLIDINKHVPHEAIGEQWSIALVHKWTSESDAYAMEQRVLARLVAKRTEGERVICSDVELHEAWMRSISPVHA